ncbi:hypothetical protein EVAR_80866_1 [Eumeta japonica]|uniref:Uncharacterized protein n=1 Tax=Eumeta variegata TaxID=151549 RepID=A0A4C1V0R8_EUMVA|nr:hypothetical protein EVAR_80866_1 [Eumeta japonica]
MQTDGPTSSKISKPLDQFILAAFVARCPVAYHSGLMLRIIIEFPCCGSEQFGKFTSQGSEDVSELTK